jgi:hypothetical protein
LTVARRELRYEAQPALQIDQAVKPGLMMQWRTELTALQNVGLALNPPAGE